MTKVNTYVQAQLASSLVGVPQADTSSAELSGQIANDTGSLAQDALQLAAQKQRVIDEQREKLQDMNDTLTAYNASTNLEMEMTDSINKIKAQNIDNPQSAIEQVRDMGSDLIQSKIAHGDYSDSVKEKMAGIVTNSFRGKLSETESWALAQDTANAQGKIQSTLSALNSMAAIATDINKVQDLLTFLGKSFDGFKGTQYEGVPFGKCIEMAYGKTAPKEIAKAKTDIAKSYIIGMLDRKEVNKAIATLDSGAFDSLINPKERLQFKNMANTILTNEKKQAQLDNMMSIYNIQANAVIQQSQGKYSLSQGLEDAKKIESLGGKPSTMLTQVKAGASADAANRKAQNKATHDLQRNSAIGDITNTLAEIAKGNKIDPHAQLKDVLTFNNKVEKYADAGLLTTREKAMYMTKANSALVTRVKNMHTNIFGMPQGDLRGNDEYHKAYLSIYNFAQKNYAGKSNQCHAINNLLLEYTDQCTRLEAKQGNPVNARQSQNILNYCINNGKGGKRTLNPYLNNIPSSGRLMRDKYGRTVKMFPNGRVEIIK